MTEPRIRIVCGAYGVGKSECAIALARAAASPVTLIDLDVVNPYFRSRQARQVLESEGITVIGNSLGIDTGVDIPAVSGAVAPALRDPTRTVVVDLGGDPVGSRVLRQFLPHIDANRTDVFYVVNRYRPANESVARTIASLREIEDVVGMACTAFINNSHMLHETTCGHINAGRTLCREVASETGRPVAYTAGIQELLAACGALTDAPAETHFVEPHLYVSPVLREDWMNLRR